MGNRCCKRLCVVIEICEKTTLYKIAVAYSEASLLEKNKAGLETNLTVLIIFMQSINLNVQNYCAQFF